MLVSDKTYSVVTACDFHLKTCPVETEGLQYWRFLQVEPETDETSLKKARHSENETRKLKTRTKMIIIKNSHHNQYSQFWTHQYIFQLEISVNDTLSVNVFQSIGDVFCPSDHISRSCSSWWPTRYISFMPENVPHQVFLTELHHQYCFQLLPFLMQCCTIELYNKGTIKLPTKRKRNVNNLHL